MWAAGFCFVIALVFFYNAAVLPWQVLPLVIVNYLIGLYYVVIGAITGYRAANRDL